MSKRKRVPAALHSELTEYSSLLRALRTNDTLDVVSHLTKPRHIVPTYDEDLLDSDEDLESVSEPPVLSEPDVIHATDPSTSTNTDTARSKPRAEKRKRKTSTNAAINRTHKRDTWTRWPLLSEDVHVPEWGLEDEIGLLASHAIKCHPPPSTSNPQLGIHPCPDSHPPEPDIEVESDGYSDSDPPSYLPALTLQVSNHLSQILALLVAHTFPREKSLQNRIEPIGWETVLDVLGSESGLVDDKIIANVKTRMEMFYGGSRSVAHRVQKSTTAKHKLSDALSNQELSFLNLATPSTASLTPCRNKRKRNNKRKKKSPEVPAIMEDCETSSVDEDQDSS